MKREFSTYAYATGVLLGEISNTRVRATTAGFLLEIGNIEGAKAEIDTIIEETARGRVDFVVMKPEDRRIKIVEEVQETLWRVLDMQGISSEARDLLEVLEHRIRREL